MDEQYLPNVVTKNRSNQENKISETIVKHLLHRFISKNLSLVIENRKWRYKKRIFQK